MRSETEQDKARTKFLDNLKELPTLPTVVAQVMFTLDEPTSSARDLERLVINDQAIAARLLKLANSAFYGLPGKVNSLSRAVTLLGFNTVRSLVLTIGIVNKFSGQSGTRLFDRGEFWEHSLSVAVASKLLCSKVNTVNPEEAHISGLLHDLGRVIMDNCMPDKFEKVIRLVLEKGMNPSEAELTVLGLTHCEAGAIAATKWHFPEFIRESMAYHHNPDEAVNFPVLVEGIHVADLIVKAFDGQEKAGEELHFPEIDPDLKSRWLPTPRDEELFMTKYEVEVERVQDIIALFE